MHGPLNLRERLGELIRKVKYVSDSRRLSLPTASVRAVGDWTALI